MKPSKGKVYRYIFCKLKIFPNALCKVLIQKENLPPDSFKLALISKGLRQYAFNGSFQPFQCFKLALISKGLRLEVIDHEILQEKFKACADFKGINTHKRDKRRPRRG
ncbi:MAG: hypothetical protein KIG95_10340, partial [Comamonas sp.]|nr:hypothetical protein [Comamonas sp.]